MQRPRIMTAAPDPPRLRVVIAEDNSAMRDWLRLVLRPLWATISEVDSGSRLLEVLANEGPVDLVITDIRMPAPNGLQVVAMAREAGLDVPFIIITAFPDPAVLQFMARVPGRVFLLGKPFEAPELLAVSRMALAGRERG